KKTDQKTGLSAKGASKPAAGRASPLMGKKTQGLQQESGSQAASTSLSGISGVSQYDDGGTPGASSEDLVLDNGSDTGTDDVDSGEGSTRTKQIIETLQGKIQKTKEAIKKEQNTKE
ncbi:unnamed protein product, partial [Candidula unifasciata]